MHGIVSLLDDKHYQLVENLWAELEREFAVRGVYNTPYPHFSYQIAQDYNVEQLEPILQRFATGRAAFQVKTSGIRLFTGPHPVLHIPVVRDHELTRVHQELWPDISAAGSGISDYYHPANWMPHITIGFGDINKENLPHIVRSLAERDFIWAITIDNVALIYDTGTKQELKARFAFGTN